MLLIFITEIATAQNCKATLGDPVMNITFGAGTHFGPPLAPGITNLEYVQDQCPVDGQYTITNRTRGCWSAPHGWRNINRDHTGDPNGYFMLINGSVFPSVFYVQTIDGLCPGMTYEFAVWLLSPDTARTDNHADITFIIETPDGTMLQQSTTGDLPKRTEKWLQYKVFFTITTNTTSVVVRLRNNAPGGYGNDIAMDDITFRPAGPDLNVGISGFPGSKVTICSSAKTPLHFFSFTENCYTASAYQWQVSTDSGIKWMDIPGAVNSTYDRPVTAAGIYFYRLLVGPVGSEEKSSCHIVSSSLTVQVVPVCESYFPTAFTPNKDGKNDQFKGLNLGFANEYYFSVYNRWGQKIFETADYTKGWDGTFNGKPQPNDIYIWLCTFKKPGSQLKSNLKGTVLLIR